MEWFSWTWFIGGFSLVMWAYAAYCWGRGSGLKEGAAWIAREEKHRHDLAIIERGTLVVGLHQAQADGGFPRLWEYLMCIPHPSESKEPYSWDDHLLAFPKALGSTELEELIKRRADEAMRKVEAN